MLDKQQLEQIYVTLKRKEIIAGYFEASKPRAGWAQGLSLAVAVAL